MTQPTTFADVYEQLKYWGPILTFLGLCWKGVQSLTAMHSGIHEIKSNHLEHIQQGMLDLGKAFKDHGDEEVRELRDLRDDFRTYFREKE